LAGGDRDAERDGLRAFLDRLDSTACILTTVWEGRRAACLATYVVAAGLRNQRVLALTSHENLTHELVDRSGVLAVHVVGADQADWVARFGFQSSRNVDKLDGVRWREGETGCALLLDALAYVEGPVVASLDCGDHTARLVEPLAGALLRPDAEPLTMLEIVRRGLDGPRVEPAAG
jgi:flavin reductase (DIM6/NTAB) family NADH-FMN oxidoreductase RutF